MTKVKEKILRFKEKYDEIIEKEDQINKPVLYISKHTYVEGIDYLWVVFRNNETTKTVHQLYEEEHPISIICRKLFCIKNNQESKA